MLLQWCKAGAVMAILGSRPLLFVSLLNVQYGIQKSVSEFNADTTVDGFLDGKGING